MEEIVEKCAGLDVHQKVIAVCVLTPGAKGKPRKEVRKFGTFTRDLQVMREWLVERGVTHVAMESTGVYWKPVYYALEGAFELIVGNARHIKNVPGRKTDVSDSEWLATLVRHGLIKKSFVPPPPIRELRDMLRYRTKLVQARTAERNRLQGMLETANIKLGSVASDVFGVSGMAMVRALVDGKTDARELAAMAKGRLRTKMAELELALDGHVEDHHRFVLDMQLRRLEETDRHLAVLDARIDEKLAPYADVHALLMQIPGVDRVTAAVIIAELGVDMSVFLSAYHLASWAGVCPGNNETGGKRRRGTARKGNVHLRSILVQAASSAARKKGSYYKDKFHRLKGRLGAKRAALAIAHKMLIAAYFMISRNVGYQELGDTYLDQQAKPRVAKALVKRLERLGFEVAITQKAA